MPGRAALLDATARLLARRPLAEIRIDDITTEAGMAHGSFYLHFTGKEDLARALADECRDLLVPLVRRLSLVVGSSPGDEHALRRWLDLYLQAFLLRGGGVRASAELSAADPSAAEAAADTARELVDRLAAGGGPPAGLRAVVALCLLERFPARALTDAADVDRETVRDTMARLLLRALPTPDRPPDHPAH